MYKLTSKTGDSIQFNNHHFSHLPSAQGAWAPSATYGKQAPGATQKRHWHLVPPIRPAGKRPEQSRGPWSCPSRQFEMAPSVSENFISPGTYCVWLQEEEPQAAHPMPIIWASHKATSMKMGPQTQSITAHWRMGTRPNGHSQLVLHDKGHGQQVPPSMGRPDGCHPPPGTANGHGQDLTMSIGKIQPWAWAQRKQPPWWVPLLKGQWVLGNTHSLSSLKPPLAQCRAQLARGNGQ